MDITALFNSLTFTTDNKLKTPDSVEESFSDVLAAFAGENSREATGLLAEVLAGSRELLVAEGLGEGNKPESVEELQIENSEISLSELAAGGAAPVAATVDRLQAQSSIPIAVAPDLPSNKSAVAGDTEASQEIPPATHFHPAKAQVNTVPIPAAPDGRVQFPSPNATEGPDFHLPTEPATSLWPTAAVDGKLNSGSPEAAHLVSAAHQAPAQLTISDPMAAKTSVFSSVASDYSLSSATVGQVTGDTAPQQTGNAQSNSASVSAVLQSPLTSQHWGRELEQQLVGLVQRGGHSVELQLNPRELGPLSVSLSMEDQSAKLQFFSPHSLVRTAVEQAIPQLRDALAQQGINLAEASVGEQQQHQREGTDQGHHQPVAGGNEVIQETAVVSTAPAATATKVYLGGVDLYA